MGCRQICGESIEYAKDFVENHWDDEVTFVGHSKGGAEAAANALRLNKKLYNI